MSVLEIVFAILGVLLLPVIGWTAVAVITIQRERRCAEHTQAIADIYTTINTTAKQVSEIHGWLKGRFNGQALKSPYPK